MKNKLFITLLLSFFSLLSLPSVSNASIVRTVKSSQVTGENATGKTIEVWAGHGVSISFYSSGEVIQKIWFDDPSQFIVDVDGCLEGMPNCSTENVGAGLIHIRRINKVNIPGLPKASYYGSHLTVITVSSSGKKVYHFSIVPGTGRPEYSQIEIIPSSIASNQPTQRTPDYTALSDSRFIAQGMKIAQDNQWLAANGQLWQKLNRVVTERSKGTDLRLAASSAGVSMQVIEKLMRIGGKSYLEMPPRNIPNPNNNQSPNNPNSTTEAENVVFEKLKSR
ncbi:hypothetical protein NIES4071_102310 (plasmid) [Calothrix sp. NIES-4071]|nr:hypothetical protein NIES4071_102310 [Calothrix sp. NIES-4071]BAZ64612.1 hypothetical protein NIES4105_103450 [Calothrix sp. NIES-4105]